MKNKSDLKRKVLCSLLAASTMGIFYSSDALAAKINGEDVGSTITNEVIFDMDEPSGKLVVGQGEVNIQAGADIPTILNRYEMAMKPVDQGGLGMTSEIAALRYALKPVEGEQTPIVGVVGGEVKYSENIKNILNSIKEDMEPADAAVIDKILAGETANKDSYNGGTTVTIGSSTVDPVVLGVINGDFAISLLDEANINRTGDIVVKLNAGNEIGGIGGSAAVAVRGVANSNVDGNVYKEVSGNANIGIYANGGMAATLLGGNATSTVDGNTSLVIDTTTGEEGAIDALTVGVAGGGAALAIAGGNATSNVTGTTYVEVGGNGTAIGVIGGGVAGSIDISGDGSSSSNAITSTASTGRTHVVINFSKTPENSSALQAAVGNIKDGLTNDTGIDTNKVMAGIQGLVGQNSAIGVTGGGLAIANKSDNVGATVITNGTDIDLRKGYATGVFANGFALSTNYAEAIAEMTDTANINIEKDMHAVGVFGNGLAYFTGSSNGGTENLTGMATASAENTNINIKGYAEGVIGGGLAIDDSQSDTTNAKVETTGTATINVHDGATVEKLDFNGLKPLAGAPADKNGSSPDFGSYTFAVEAAVKDVAIAAGGVAVGGGAESTVKDGVVNIYGGEVKGDVLAGGVAVYGEKGADEKAVGGANMEKATLNLNGGTITGNVYAGGATVNDTYSTVADDKEYTSATATVDKAFINLAGTDVTGEIVGAGYRIEEVSYTDPTGGQTLGTNVIGDKVLATDASKSTLNLQAENTLKALETGSKIHSFDFINATAGSVTKVEGLNNTTALIDADGTTVNVDDSAKLDINALAADGTSYKVVSTANDGSSFWDDSNLVYDRTVGYAYGEGQTEGNYNVKYKDLDSLTEDEKTEAVNDFVDSLGEGGENFEGAVNGIIRNGENTFAGAEKFFSEASSTGDNSGLAAMAMIGEAAGVTSNTIDVAGDMADNSVLRLSFTQDNITGEPKVNEDGAIWAKYIHNKHDLDGMASSFGSVDSSSDFDGATIGVDFAKKGKVQSGIAFSYGSGDSHGMGINNDFDMWGVSLYGNVKNDDTNVIADIGFSESDNELTGTAMGKDIKADRDVSVFTVGVRAEKLYTNGSTQIVPYTGLRYYNVDPDSYTAYYDGQKFGEYDADRQNIWTLPVGVSLRNETVTESGWRLTPKVDVAYIWAFGDTDNSFDLNTGSGVDTLDYTVMDSGSWLGSVGFEAGKDNWAFGVGYSYQKGSHEEANKWFVNVEYSF